MVKSKFFSLKWLPVLLVITATGCSFFEPLTKPRPEIRPTLTDGTIVVGRPEVFTFNRLIDQEQKDFELLTRKLDAYDPNRFQALREVRGYGAISTPAAMAEGSPDSSEGQVETSAPLQEAEPADAAATGKAETQGETPQTAPPASQPQASAVTMPDHNLPSAGNLLATKAKLSAYEEVLDELVYRDMINSEIRSITRDDSLASMGFTIYSLNFNITVIPGINTYTLGEAALNMTFDQTVSEAFFRRWRKQLQADLVDQAFTIQSRWVSGNLSDREKRTLQQYASQLQQKLRERVEKLEGDLQDLSSRRQALAQDQEDSSAGIAKLEKEVENLETELAQTPQKASTLITRQGLELRKSGAEKKIQALRQKIAKNDTLLNKNKQDQAREERALSTLKRKIEDNDRFALNLTAAETGSLGGNQIVLCDIIRDQFMDNIGGIVAFLPHSRINVDGSALYFPQLDLHPDQKTEAAQFGRFKQLLIDMKQVPYVQSVEPRQYAQNISEATARDVIVGSDKNTLVIQQGITRRPLAVGYVRGTNEFGWILGPRQEVDEEGNPLVRHVPIQYVFQVQLHVPAWLESIRLHGKFYWRKEDGSIGQGADIWDGEIEVRLPGEPEGVTSALMREVMQHHPVILPPWATDDRQDRFYFRQGQKATMMIRGYELWRHPKVFLGTQRASSIEIMPDLGGLIISFEAIAAPQQPYPGKKLLDLVIVTSSGEAVLKNAAEILPPIEEINSVKVR